LEPYFQILLLNSTFESLTIWYHDVNNNSYHGYVHHALHILFLGLNKVYNTLRIGANSGVGFAAAKVIAASSSDYHVIVSGRSQEKIDKALAELKGTNPKAELSVLQLDVTNQTSIKQAVASVEKQFGRLDVLINNAGIASQDPDLQVQYTETLTTNVIGPALVADAFRPLLLKSKSAYSIYVSSGLGSLQLASDPASPIYSAEYTCYRTSKAALDMLIVQDYKASKKTAPNVKIFAFCPGLVVSNLRGTSEEDRLVGGMAGDPDVSGRSLLSIIKGERDTDVGKFVHKDGVYPW
jgi:NAD(P)-dependent dehydrogenase (short-subunit alcohol dehydrogenase family)